MSTGVVNTICLMRAIRTTELFNIFVHVYGFARSEYIAPNSAGPASIPGAPLGAASIPSLFEHVVEAYTT